MCTKMLRYVEIVFLLLPLVVSLPINCPPGGKTYYLDGKARNCHETVRVCGFQYEASRPQACCNDFLNILCGSAGGSMAANSAVPSTAELTTNFPVWMIVVMVLLVVAAIIVVVTLILVGQDRRQRWWRKFTRLFACQQQGREQCEGVANINDGQSASGTDGNPSGHSSGQRLDSSPTSVTHGQPQNSSNQVALIHTTPNGQSQSLPSSSHDAQTGSDEALVTNAATPLLPASAQRDQQQDGTSAEVSTSTQSQSANNFGREVAWQQPMVTNSELHRLPSASIELSVGNYVFTHDNRESVFHHSLSAQPALANVSARRSPEGELVDQDGLHSSYSYTVPT